MPLTDFREIDGRLSKKCIREIIQYAVAIVLSFLLWCLSSKILQGQL